MSAPRRVRPPPFRWDFVEESFSEAEFLWGRRQSALESTEYVLSELSRFIEERLLGCLDGVMLAGEAAHERLLVPALLGEEPRLASVAAWCLASSGERGLSLVAAVLEQAEEPSLQALRAGLELVMWPELGARLEGLRNAASPRVHAALLEVFAFQGRGAGATLNELVRHPDPMLSAAALRAARFDARPAAEIAVGQGLEHAAAVCQWAAIETGLVLGLEAVRGLALESWKQPWRPEYHRVWALTAALNPKQSSLTAALGDEKGLPGAAWALGFAGTRDAADHCVALMTEGRVPELALDSFCNIVGCDPVVERLAQAPAPPADSPETLDEDDLDADLRLAVEVARWVPDPAQVTAYWARRREQFSPELRYQRGRAVSSPSELRELLWDLPLGRRHVTALELAARTCGVEQFNPRAWCREQRARLTQLTQATPETAPLPEPV
ncbi:MAG TPA: hypothetical protein VFQ61_29485 [Polyangiaceae bacterium]|nr:hypothetical protein [Polyangiaceae bacterium]